MSEATVEIIKPTEETPKRQPDMKRDLSAIGLIAATLILTVSLITRDPADPVESPVWPINAIYQPDNLAYPGNATITNACGYWGALLSAMVMDAVGIGAALVVAYGGGIATALMIRGRMNAPVLRSLGGCIVLVAVTAAAALSGAQFYGMPVVGAGGYLGAMTSEYLLAHFAPAGAWILTLTVLTTGVLMTTDYALLYAGQKVVGGAARMKNKTLAGAARVLPVRPRRVHEPFADPETAVQLAEENVGESADESGVQVIDDPDAPRSPRIKVRKKPKNSPATNTDEAEDASQSDVQTVDVADDDYTDQYDEGDWDESDDDADSVTRELDVDGEQVTLRQDEPHEAVKAPTPAPKVKVPNRAKEKRDDRAELYDAMEEDAPAGSEDYVLPPLELLNPSEDVCYDEQLIEVRRKAQLLEEAFRNFNLNVRVVEIETGPVIAQYEIELEAGLRLSKITGLADDIAIALRVPSVRIVAPIPGKNTVGIEVPNETRQVVRLRDVIEESGDQAAKMNIPVFLGQDVSGNPMVVDLAKMPHLLIAGRTGTGKSVCLNAIISSVLMCCRPDEVRMLMIDPKMVELSGYGQLPHLMHPVITDMKKAEAILAWAVEKMEERYSLLAKVGVRHINSFNDLGREEVLRRLEVEEEDGGDNVPDKLPFIVIVADEMADLMMTAGKDVEQHIIRLAQKSRAVGIHLILATQKPTVDVITGLIKSNLPARLSFQVASKTDSRVVLDENGADKLLGNGDMLFLWPGTSTLIRGQGTYLSDKEIDDVCAHCSRGEQNFVGELMNLKVTEDGEEGGDLDVNNLRKKDELYESAIEVVVREQRGSISLIQRCLGIGYGRAARLIDYMEEDGIVSAYNGQKSREVIISPEQWQQMQGIEVEESESDGDDETLEGTYEHAADGEYVDYDE
ncbi:FtsK/SpoIIIE family DNA translocase [Crateriforma conspicua]|uniref:DNA translocase FtsK n=1 Tax=Crateriforma conspicua TaxID=2527996 RepID=A0A5C6FZ22_9PLAN|nr:DNA translocase FtsK [Crateriforma conspicua]TWU66875.1 DNA translocase FtsK [Crateriforma conspicua]